MADAAVWVDPGRQGGSPCIFGSRMPTEQVAHLVWDGGIETVHRGWPYFTDQQILGACWYEVIYGNRRRWRKRFPDWPTQWDEQQWRDR